MSPARAALLTLAVAAWCPPLRAQEPLGTAASPPELAERIRIRIESSHAVGATHLAAVGERIHAAVQLPRFYERRGFEPAWVDEHGPLALGDSLVWMVERAVLDGLQPGDYHLRPIRSLLADLRLARRTGERPDPARLVDLELLMTDAFLILGAQLVAGRVDPVRMHPEWSATRSEGDVVLKLEAAIEAGRLGEARSAMYPRHPGYHRLRELLREYREIAAWGGWPELPGRTLRPGMRDPAVATLRDRLRMTHDLPATARVAPGREDYFDDALVLAVRRFQARHALTVDGVVGLQTSAILNVPVERRIREIELNLERWRWLPRELGERHVLVNIAAFEMDVFQGDSSVFHSRVMVGQRYRRTPVFSHRMTYLVVNPTWTIPPGILEMDHLPLLRRDPGHLARNRIRVLRPDGRTVDPATIRWDTVTARTPIRLRMDAGPENPLGKVKFMFPNPYHVYLHDTPARERFDLPERAFSSGCVRVERARDLYDFLLRDAPGWDATRRDAAWQATAERTITLPRPVPIHILYWTAWVDREGVAHFRSDIYDRDRPLDEALRSPPPPPLPGAGR